MAKEQIAKSSDVSSSPKAHPQWRGGIAGDVFVEDTEPNVLRFGDRIMYDCPVGDNVSWNLPSTTPEDAGKHVAFGNIGDGTNGIGNFFLYPNGADYIENFSPGEPVKLISYLAVPTFEMEFVGDGRWMHTCPVQGTNSIFEAAFPPPAPP